MRRGSVIVAAGGADYMGKPRPAVVVQGFGFETLNSVTVCPISSRDPDAPDIRVVLEPSSANGLDQRSWVMVDKISTVHRSKIRRTIGLLSQSELSALDRSLASYLGLGRR